MEDAVSRDEKFTLVGDADEAKTKDLSQATTTALIGHEEPTAYQLTAKGESDRSWKGRNEVVRRL